MKLLTAILALLIMMLSVLPCCTTGSCAGEEPGIEQNTGSKDAHGEEVCSPFYSCATCTGFTVAAHSTVVLTLETLETQDFGNHTEIFISGFHHAIWQPPKIS